MATGTVNDPVASGSDYLVKPISTGHQTLTFRVKVTLSGGKTEFFGPYTLYVGCISGRVSYTDGATTALQGVPVGGATAGAFIFDNPIGDPAWCTVQSNAVVNAAGGWTSWSGAAKLTGSGTSFSLISTAVAEDISFKVLSTFPNGLTHLSPAFTSRINCLTTFIDGDDQDNFQLMEHGDAAGFYALPTFTTTVAAGCVADPIV